VVAEEPAARDGVLLSGFPSGSLVASYRIIDQAGAGGMAVVFRARDERLGRVVALKVLAPALAADAGFRQRFMRESRAASAVDDPHIIPVYEAGEADGALFIAMRFVSGGDLAAVLDREGPLPAGRVAGFISPVAAALDAAHAAGLVHRDVKPANMLVDTRPGRPDHVYLSDFGLSKGALWSASLTGSGHFLGTPHYAAPEQAAGRAVDGRADQYALACAAFTLLAGVPPFVRDPPMAVLLAHLSDPPPSLTSLRPDLPGAVDRVMAKAMAKAPEDRYGRCQDFARALRDALGLPPYALAAAVPDHPPAQAGHPPTREAQRPRKTPGAGDAARQAAQAADAVGATTLTTPPAPGPPAPGPPVPARRWPLRGSRRRRVGAAVLAAVLLVTVAVIAALQDGGGHSPDLSDLSVATSRIATLPVPASPDGIAVAAFSPDGTVLATADDNDSTYLWNTTTRTRIATVTKPPGGFGLGGVAFSPGGGLLATAADKGSTYLWNTTTWTRITTLTDPGGPGLYVPPVAAFSPGGRLLATADGNGSTYLWNTTTWTRITTLTDPDGQNVQCASFSPSGRLLATADGNGSTYLWNTTTWTRIITLAGPGQDFQCASFSPSGRLLATADGKGSTYLWNTTTWTRIATVTDPHSGSDGVNAASFSPSGKLLATADSNGSTYLWNTTTWTRIATVTDPHSGSDGVNAASFSPDGKILATADSNGSTYLWSVTETPGAGR
jgi:hypothetical protein